MHYIWQHQSKYPHEILGIPVEEVSWERVKAFVLASTMIALQDGDRPIIAKDFMKKDEI